MKSSRYNHFFEIRSEGVILAYNSFSGALAEIEKENYDRVRYLLNYPDQADSTRDPEFIQCLQEGGFLIPDGVDETSILKARSHRLRLEGSVLTLTIAPTLACNFNCDYCYESRSTTTMNETTQEALLDFSDRHLVRAERMRICWFGGEPTLCMTIIERLQRGLLELAEKHQIDVVPGTIVSNGYLLDAGMAGRLKELGIARAQVTIDGPEEVHNRRRRLRNGRGTFRRIIDNLCETTGILDVSIRINVDKDNMDSAYEVIEILRQRDILSRVKIHFAQVRSSGAVCADISDRCYGDEDFSRTLVDIYSRLVDRGVNQVDYPRVFTGASFCGALADGYFVVSPTGQLFKCWEELSDDAGKSVGNIFSSQLEDYQRKNLEAYRAWNPFEMAECRDCGILPICMGGCPVHGMKRPGATRGVCLPWKYNLNKMIELKYRCETGEAVKQ